MGGSEEWQLDAAAPRLYERYLVPAITALWGADLVERAAPSTGETVLDVACGTGIVARLAAKRMASGRVVGLDLNPGMLEVARSLAAKGPVQCEWFDGSALAMPFAAATFDIVFCQLGLQFFPNRPSALAEMRRVLVPGGRLALSVYSAIERTPAAHAFADALDAHFGAGASSTKRSEHALSDRRELQRLAQGAGFVDIRIEIVTQEIRFPSCREYVLFQLLATPMAALLSHMGDAERQGVIEALAGRVGAALAAHIRDGQLIFPQEAHVLLARR